jgi:hypothetical protein
MIVQYAVPRVPQVPREDIELAAEVGVRLMISLILTPEGVIDLDDPERLRDLGRRVLPYALLTPPGRPARQARKR